MPNLAEYKKGMTRCTAEVWESQKTCAYAKKSTYADRCLFYVINKHGLRRCDSIDAQETARK